MLPSFCIIDIYLDTNVVTVKVEQGHSALLPCDVIYPGPVLPPHVIEWFVKGNPVPIYIKVGKYPPHINPQFEGKINLDSLSPTNH